MEKKCDCLICTGKCAVCGEASLVGVYKIGFKMTQGGIDVDKSGHRIEAACSNCGQEYNMKQQGFIIEDAPVVKFLTGGDFHMLPMTGPKLVK